ncbi:hypothetical protein ACQEVZ_50640 [Dactylosporangium sp. CA-152071]|uniref:sialidase family protein n=1 Tax=Dactylosporangium sp. CA-152071 TaxID=3239933 RepID=UPI003D8E06C9
MNQIRERFDEAAGEAPPSRLSADAVYERAFQRRRRRAAGWTAVAAAVATTAVVAAATLTPSGGQPADPPTQTADGWPTGTRDGSIVSIAAADAEHLYAKVNACGEGARCTVNLVGSDDGGKTWTVRSEDVAGDVSAPSPGVLAQTVEQQNTDPAGPQLLHIPMVSRDGGRSWRVVETVAGKVPKVPAGGWIICAPPTRPADLCTMLAVDPVTARATLLANPPDIDVHDTVAVPAAGGLWVSGWERGGEHRPAVSVSHDGGVTWATSVFGRGDADFPAPEMYVYPAVDSVDGVTGYTVITQPDPADTTGVGPTSAATAGVRTLVYRTGDGGRTWQRVHPGQTLPRAAYQEGDAYVAAGGTHVVLTRMDPPQEWYASTDGGQTYRPAKQPGLGTALLHTAGERVLAAGPGAYYAFDADALYRSSNGLQWTRTVVKVTG